MIEISKAEVFEHWKDWLDVNGFDWGEPTCWACGCFWNGRYDVSKKNLGNWDAIYRAWERAPLQRCHIIPRSLGGTDEASNLFLMCRECHDLAPNTPFVEEFFLWVERQDWYSRRVEPLRKVLRDYGFEDGDYALIVQTIQSDEFRRWSDGKIGIHRSQKGSSGYAYHNGGTTACIPAWWAMTVVVNTALVNAKPRPGCSGKVEKPKPGLPYTRYLTKQSSDCHSCGTIGVI